MVRGALDDVLVRFITVIDEFASDTVVRLTADCPLGSRTAVDRVVQIFLKGEFHYVSNTLSPTYPDQLDFEVVRPQALPCVIEQSSDPPRARARGPRGLSAI